MQLTYQKLNENQMRNKKNQINCNIATTIIEQMLRKIHSILALTNDISVAQ